MHILVIFFIIEHCFAGISTKNTKTLQVLDLSHDLNNETIYWPTGSPFKLIIQHRGPTNSSGKDGLDGDSYWYEANKIETPEHLGTHLDAPVHFGQGQWSVDQIPPERFISSVSVVDLRDVVKDNAECLITTADLQQWESNNDQHVKPLIILWTGWANRWPNRERYLGTSTLNESLLHFPGLHPDTARWLVNSRLVYGVGIDTPSMDYGQSRDILSHRTFAKNNIFILENLNTKEIEKMSKMNDLWLVVNPLKISGGSGSPIRPLLISGALNSVSGSSYATIPTYCGLVVAGLWFIRSFL